MAEEEVKYDLWGVNPFGRVNPFARVYHDPGYALDWSWPKREHARGQGIWSPPNWPNAGTN
jgi:hypothetical protein